VKKAVKILVAAIGLGLFASLHAADEDILQRLDRIERLLQSQGLLDMLQQIETLQRELSALNGEIEYQNYTLEQLKKRQRDLYTDIDQRLQKLERGGVAAAGADPSPVPSESAPAPGAEPELLALLAHAVRLGASDVHLKVPSPPTLRINGGLAPITGHRGLSSKDTEAFAEVVLAAHPASRQEFAAAGEVDLAYSVPRVGRFRVSVFRQRGTVSLALRHVPAVAGTIDDLRLPASVSALAREERGIVLVTGTTGSGKSTTLAAMINQINESETRHVVTIEDPIEYLHRDNRSIVNQREVGSDTPEFATALRRVLRQDPDVIMLGEIRDAETMETALSAAETGHLVLSTMHTLDAIETVNRVIGFFPLRQQAAVRSMRAGTLRGVVSQRLVRTADGAVRGPACEVLVGTGRARDMITNPDETSRLVEVIRSGDFYGMQTFDQSLFGHVRSGLVALDDALRAATSPHDFTLMLQANAPRRETAQYEGSAPA